ncbi:MAG TPA: hypothetical protein VFD32_04750 [Dehalococcoidia bacterium]|nr:hypothetical protein [Dehalococcoidia bacterium]
MAAVEHAHAQSHDPAIRELAAEWWAARREIRPAAVWQVPFPPRAAETVRVTHDPDGGEWYAALMRPRALTAYIEVHNAEGPIGALVSLYEHVA